MVSATPAQLRDYVIRSPDRILTPALLVYADKVRNNIARTIALLGGDPGRWRPHVKTAKLAWVMRFLVQQGVKSFKCATTRELLVACESGAQDVLVAFPHTGANAARVAEVARHWPEVRVSVLIDAESQIESWAGRSVAAFIDINPGMDRTGIPELDVDRVCAVASAIRKAGLPLNGVHYYDGHLVSEDFEQRSVAAHLGYDRLLLVVAALERNGFKVPEVVTAGTPTFLCSIRYSGFRRASLRHSVSPGTVVYCDALSMSQLPPACGYEYAVLVLSRVVSHPREGIVTCDAGHKAVSADAGLPTCQVLGHEMLRPLRPSEEHLPIATPQAVQPAVGSLLYLVPRHVCPTVNLFDSALLIEEGHITGSERVTARGREDALLRPSR